MSVLRIPAALLLLSLCTQPALAEVYEFECSFEMYANAEEGLQKVKDGFGFKITTDTLTDDSYLVGNQGVEPITVFKGANAWTFMEVTGTLNIMSTTIVTDPGIGSEFGDAVHSRNTVLNGTLIPSQYYGRCAVL